jgi:hypothetical protein
MNVLYRNYYKLARALSEHEDIRRVKHTGQTVDANETAFLHYPEVTDVRNPWHGYANCRRYFWYHKRGQRNVLEDYFDIPARAQNSEPPYVVRPLRHFGGRDFYVAETEDQLRAARQEISGGTYAVEMVRRTREFRAFFVGGEHSTTMLKSLDDYGYAEAENMPPLDDDDLQAQPWNRDQMGTRYLTVTRSVNDKLGDTSFYDDARRFFDDYPFDLLAIDAAYNDNDNTYTVFETNFAPQCTIESSLEPMMENLLTLPRFSTDSSP